MGNHRDKKHHSSGHSSGHRPRRGHGNPDDYSHQHQLDPLEVYGDGYGAYPSSAAMSSGQAGGSMEYGDTTDIRAPRSPHEPDPFSDSHDQVYPEVYGAAHRDSFDTEDNAYIVAGGSGRRKGKQVDYDNDILDEVDVAISGAYNDLTEEDLDENMDRQLQEALRQSRHPSYAGESSSGPSYLHNDFPEPTELDTILQEMSLEEQEQQQQQLSPQQRQKKLPKSRGPQNQKRGKPSLVHGIDFAEFRVEPSWKFRLGAVLKMPWSQPSGYRHNETVTDPVSDPFYNSIRRFIIVAQQPGHSTAVAIYTYGRQGCLKHGVHQAAHGAAYDELYGDPGLLPGEPFLGFESVPIAISDELVGVEELDPISRVNYAKLHTIEHNARVKFIGDVSPNYIDTVLAAVDQCWSNQKSSKPRGSGHKGKDKRRK